MKHQAGCLDVGLRSKFRMPNADSSLSQSVKGLVVASSFQGENMRALCLSGQVENLSVMKAGYNDRLGSGDDQ